MLRLRKRKRSNPVSDNADSEDIADDPAADKSDHDWQNKDPCKRLKPSPQVVCILHNPSLKDTVFVPFSKMKETVPEKLASLHKIKIDRLSEPVESPYRLQQVCDQIPESISDGDVDDVGYHRLCYQKFTANLNRLSSAKMSSDSPSALRRSPRKRLHAEKRTFPDECIFCTQKKKKNDQHLKKFPSFEDKYAQWKKIEPQALDLKKMALYRKVQGEDLWAREAQFHQTCYNAFKLEHTNFVNRRSEGNVTSSYNSRKTEAHAGALAYVVEHIQQHIVQRKEIMELNSLRRLYVEQLEKSGFPSPDYRSDRLKIRLTEQDISKFIGFAKIDPGDRGFISYTLVYNSSLSVSDAVTLAYKLGSKDKYKDLALSLRTIIENAYRESPALPFPPTPDDLEKKPPIPDELTKFLAFVIGGDAKVDKTDRIHRLVLSIGQDICRAVTHGQWKLPKHILLAVTIRHLYRSKQLTTILNRMGHSESYDFSLELDTMLAKALNEVSTLLTPQIVTGEGNEVFHVEWDNMNKITTNVHGCNVVNSTGGIMVQEVKPGIDPLQSASRILPEYERSGKKSRTLKVGIPEKVPPFHLYNRVGPSFPDGTIFQHPIANTALYNDSLNEYHVWFLLRVIGSGGEKQIIPGFGGFVSATGKKPLRKSTLEYFNPIHEPFTDYAVVKELLHRSEIATDAVGQKYVLSCFDLGGCMKALPIIWKLPDDFKRHVVTPGPFHTTMNYLGMLTWNKCRGSGYAEILIEAKLATSGCLTSILKGKAYAKAMFALKSVTEALQRLLLEKFIEEEGADLDNPPALLKMMQQCDRTNLNAACNDPCTKHVIAKYLQYESKVRSGHLGKTAKFWMSIIDHTRLILMLQFSVKSNNLDLFHKCNSDMADLFFAFDGPNYSRYLVWLDVFLTNIDTTHPGAKELLKKGGIAVARSLLPGSLCAVDKTMEETFMKFSTSAGGFKGIFNMYGAYEKWCRTTSTRAQYFEKTLEMCGLIDDPECPKNGRHRELEKAEIQKSEEAVQRVITAIKNFMNPFEVPDKDRLYTLSSGAPVPVDVEDHVLRAEEYGKADREKFLQERFVNGDSRELFFATIKQLKLKTMEATSKSVKLTTSQGKVIQYREQSDLAFMLLIKSQLLDEPLDLDELMKYSLTPVPHCLGTADGFFAKTNKAKMMHFLMEDFPATSNYPSDAFHVEDGNALIHVMTNLAPTFGEICIQILDQIVSKRSFIFSTDSYEVDSIKGQERLRRGSSEKFHIGGPATRKPVDFKLSLCNDDNKTQLFRLLLDVVKSNDALSKIEKYKKALFVVEGKVFQITIADGKLLSDEITEIQSNQEETDTRIVVYLKYAAQLGYESAVVRTPDSDIIFILLHHAAKVNLKIYLDTGSGKHRQLINVTEIAKEKGQDYCTAIMGLYVFTGEDVTSAFKGKGKVGPLKKLHKNPKFYNAFARIGDDWTMDESILADLEEFTCLMFGYQREKSINKVQSKMLKKMVGENTKLSSKSKVDFSKLPPCRDNLLPHCYRVSHRLAIYKRADQPSFTRPKPYSDKQGWLKDGESIEPLWSCGTILPASLIDLVEATTKEVDEAIQDEVDLEDVDVEDGDDDEESS